MSVDVLIRKALDAGVELTLVSGKLQVTGKRDVIQQWRPKLIAFKTDICRHLSAANDPEPSPDPATWRELAAAYHLHHFACPTCIAGGQGRGMRCGAGAALWTNYQHQI